MSTYYELEEDFTRDYRRFILRHGVKETHAKWFVYWIGQFVRHLKDVPLPECSADDVRTFLILLYKKEGIKDWQVTQARTARPCRCVHDDDLYACAEQAGAGGEESGGLGKTIGDL